MPPRLALPTSGELRCHAILDRLEHPEHVRVRDLGHSRQGRPIPLISVGDGPNSALVVGAPHPNEPTGCLAILRMLEQLDASPDAAPDPDWQWHFIPAIDIDGLSLNEAWFSDAPDLDAYLAHFYRPPFRLQPEYAFPLTLPDYTFRAETPESACWRSALEMIQPRLQCSLHGTDTGGAFFILSAEAPGLASQLVSLPTEYGISLNEAGEPFAEMTAFQPGVFSFPSVAGIAARGTRPEAANQTGWNAGDSSASFAGEHFGTFSMTCEVPLWRDAREGDIAPSGRTLGDVVDERIAQLREDAAIVTASLPSLRPRVESFEAAALLEALEDSLSGTVGFTSALEQSRPRGSDDHELRRTDLVWAEAGTPGFRSPAMLARLANVVGAEPIEGAARALLDRRLSLHRRSTRLAPIPLTAAADLQIAAIHTAARFLAREGDARRL